jgi:transposase
MDRMSLGEWKKLQGIERLERGEWRTGEAAAALGVSARQVRRLRRAVREHGSSAVVHGNRGRPSGRRIEAGTQARVVELRRGQYEGFNDVHFTEKLREKESIEISRASVQRMLRAAGIGAARRRRAPKHRRRRDRKAQAGLMILWDGSRHDWLEGRGPYLCLMGAIDDATGELLPGAHFVEEECGAGYLAVLKAIASEKGLPWTTYMDRHGSLKRNDDAWSLEEELRGEQDPTQVGEALRALEIESIYALSPQAKGRVERLWGTLQDRLCSEMRLVKAKSKEEANEVLARYRVDHNRRFTVEAAQTKPAWRPVPKRIDLTRVCSFRYTATVLNDNTVRLSGHVIDVAPGPQRRSYAGRRVEVRQILTGEWRVYDGDTLIAQAGSTTVREPRALRRRKPTAASVSRQKSRRRSQRARAPQGAALRAAPAARGRRP